MVISKITKKPETMLLYALKDHPRDLSRKQIRLPRAWQCKAQGTATKKKDQREVAFGNFIYRQCLF